ncbi:MAG TPA: hypothetical protein VHL10_00790 [Nitrososphaera sp.]|jgi:hypothetical protein|nr:hypothetical protein [Nitrososphaera sp.]
MLLAQDTAIRANQSGLGTSSDGQTYTITGTGTGAISSNALVITSTGSDTHAQLGSRISGDAEVFCKIVIGNINDICGVQARFSVSGGQPTAYKLLWYGGNLHLNKAVAGANTQMTTSAFSMSVGIAYWFRLRVAGLSLYGRAWQDGTAEPGIWATTTTDSAVTGAGGFAILANSAAGSSVSFSYLTALSLVGVLGLGHRQMARMLP